MNTICFGLFYKFENYLKENDDRATPGELLEIVEKHLEEKASEGKT